jgi:exonuclease SbcC
MDVKNLSGGEKSALALAFRLALKKTIELNIANSLSILILDEPTDGFSQEQIERLKQILKESTLSQILLVSHDKNLETIADHKFNIEKRNSISTIISFA